MTDLTLRVVLPHGFVATKFDGYFWNYLEQKLYSIKVGGTLRPLKRVEPNWHNQLRGPAFRISIDGQAMYYFLDRLQKLTPQGSEIKVENPYGR